MRLSCGQKPDKCRVSIEIVSTPRQTDVQTQPTQRQVVNIIKMLEVTTNTTIMLFTVIVLALVRDGHSYRSWPATFPEGQAQPSLHRGGPDGNPAVRQHPSERGKPQQRQGHRREQADHPCWHPRHPPHGGDP